MRNLMGAVVLFALALFAGCARSRITTEIKADGAFVRTVMLSGQEKKEGEMNMGTSLEDAFTLPQGDAWKVKEEKKNSERSLIYERTFAAGAGSQADLSIKGGDNDKPMLVNAVTVKKLGPGKFEYRETLTWGGRSSMKAEDLVRFKEMLPKSLATDENVRALAQRTAELAMPVFFGPSDPLIAIGLLHPDLAARRASQRIGVLLMKALEDQFGSKLKPEERREIARKAIETSFDQAKPSKPDPAAGPPDSKNSGGLTPLMFILKSPGKIVSSNGETDELTGEVYWAMFPDGASLHPVVLTAVVQLNP